ncbi:hypothetical protein SAMN02910297_00669 [Methanobrevibacter olleyae]|uniref:DUF5518 domain-containing protein n=1 Tax=Methanobrevibacter olleyae TaxID=294671 RepID=A0A1I4H2M0_METOL|nr:DUF5518 domain-containing protein [Methanobrevibacter olleyae]SFL35631.1 hypothetical protein SAMN02910297_00669 [Methanobrevibacter olleyae]
MAKMSSVFLGFLLTLVVYLFFGRYEFYGLLIVGFIVGYISQEGIVGGMWNAALAGAFGTIVSAILFIILITISGTALMGVLGGLSGFTISGITSLFAVIYEIIKYMIVMGITGAVGGALTKQKN